MDGLETFVRGQIDELVGDQIRGATEDGIRLGFKFSAEFVDGFMDNYDLDPSAVIVLTQLRDILVERGSSFSLEQE